MSTKVVNRWNDFDPLEEIIIGLPNDACSPSTEPAYEPKLSKQHLKESFLNSKKSPSSIKAAGKDLEGLKDLLEGEGITGKKSNEYLN